MTTNLYDARMAMEPCSTCGQRGHHMSWHETPAETSAREAAGREHRITTLHRTGRQVVQRLTSGSLALLPEYACDACGQTVHVEHPDLENADLDFLAHGDAPTVVRTFEAGESTQGWQAVASL